MKKIKYITLLLLVSLMIFICIKAFFINSDKKDNTKPTQDFSDLSLISTKTPDNNENSSENIFLETSKPEETTIAPTETPTEIPTETPTETPTVEPTPIPTIEPTLVPTIEPTPIPTIEPTDIITVAPVTKTPVVSTPAPVIIPTIYSPNTPEYDIYTSDNNLATIDYSNISQGYIGIKYTGSNPKVKVQISANGNKYNYDLPSTGSYVIYPLQFGDGSYTINVLENVSGTQYMSILASDIYVNIQNSSYVYLYPNQYVWFTQNSNVVRVSAEICAGLTNDIDKISAIFQYVTSNITYDYHKASTVSSGYLPDVDYILSAKTGICFDYAAVFAALCRAQGIPCKLVTGYVSPNNLYHAWNEVYTSQTGWVTSTIFLNKAGYNLLDPTFYSNMSDNQQAANYIGNGSNYQTYHIY